MKITKEALLQLYINEKKSTKQVGKMLNVSSTTASRYLRKFGIKARPFSTKGLKVRLGAKLSEKTKKKISEAHKGKRLSPKHRDKVVKTLNHGKGKDNPNWKGGKTMKYENSRSGRLKLGNGYVLISKPDHPNAYKGGYVPEHRYVMEQELGRPLGRYEHVHHINGVKDDNRPENLEVINGSTHNPITRLEARVKELEKENRLLKTKK